MFAFSIAWSWILSGVVVVLLALFVVSLLVIVAFFAYCAGLAFRAALDWWRYR